MSYFKIYILTSTLCLSITLHLFVRNQDGVRCADCGARQAAHQLCRGECAPQEDDRGAQEDPRGAEEDRGARQQAVREAEGDSQEHRAAVRQERPCPVLDVRPICVLLLDVATQVSLVKSA